MRCGDDNFFHITDGDQLMELQVRAKPGGIFDGDCAE